MNYRGQWVINKRQIPILQQCEDKELGLVLKALFKHLVQQESIESVLKGASSSVKLAFRLLTESNGDGVSPTGDGVSPSSSPLNPPSNKKGARKNYPSPLYPPNAIYFPQFWEVYPRKVGKGAAITAFSKVMPKDKDQQKELLEKMFKALEWQKRTDQWQDAAFIPHPSTWLNQRRWEDEPALSPEETAQQAQEDACADINRQMAEFSKKFAS